jgi:protein TonB
MRRTDYRTSGKERARAALAAVAVNAALGLAFLTGLALRDDGPQRDSPLVTFDVSNPPPPQPEPEPERDRPEPEPEGAAGKKAEATPVVAPPSPIPSPQPAAEKPAQGSASTSGAASAGSGPGAGGSGSGSGGGGSGGGGGIGSEARLLGGNRSRLPSSLLRTIPQERGYAHLLLTVGPAGRVAECGVLTSSGYPAIDQSLCAVMVQGSRWQPARDRAGRPITVKVRYTATWSKN